MQSILVLVAVLVFFVAAFIRSSARGIEVNQRLNSHFYDEEILLLKRLGLVLYGLTLFLFAMAYFEG